MTCAAPGELVPISEEVAFTLCSEDLAGQERRRCPRLGLAADRPALLQLGVAFKGENVATPMCCARGCEKICLEGFGKFGAVLQKGDISSMRREVVAGQITHARRS